MHVRRRLADRLFEYPTLNSQQPLIVAVELELCAVRQVGGIGAGQLDVKQLPGCDWWSIDPDMN